MPSTATDRINGVMSSVAVKAPVKAVSTGNLALAGLQTVGGVALAEGDRVLVAAQTNAVENGIYVASTLNWQRAKDFSGARDVVQGTLIVANFDGGAGLMYRVESPNPIVIGTSEILIGSFVDPNLSYPLTEEEATAGVSPTNYGYPPLDVRRYGARTANADNTAALQATYAVAEVRGGVIEYPAGIFEYSGQLTLPRGVIHRGAGRSLNINQGTVLRYTGTLDAMVDLHTPDSPGAANMRFENIGFQYETATVAQKKGLFHFLCSTYVDFVNCGFYGGEYAIIFDQAEISSVECCDFENQTTAAIWLTNGGDKTPGASELFTNRITVRKCQFNASQGVFIVDDGGVAHVFSDNNFNHGDTHIRLCGVEACQIEGNELEIANHNSISTHTTKFGGGSPGVSKCRALHIQGNFIFQTGGGTAAINIVGNSVASAAIVCNDVHTPSSIPIITNPGGADDLIAHTNFQRGAGNNEGPKLSYREGFWAPAPKFGGNSSGMAGTFSGAYTKIGRQVFCHCTLVFSAKGTSTGAMTIQGLPFQAATISTFAAANGRAANLAGAIVLCPWVQEGMSEIFVQKGNAASTADVTDTDITNTTRIDLSFNYMAAE